MIATLLLTNPYRSTRRKLVSIAESSPDLGIAAGRRLSSIIDSARSGNAPRLLASFVKIHTEQAARHMLGVMSNLYDRIGQGYNALRLPDPRIAHQILSAVGNARRIANIGAGTGSYEPRDRDVIAVEPSMTMIRQRPGGTRLAVQAVAEHLPFKDVSVDAAMAILTLHHWQDWRRGLEEVGRICRGPIVIVTWDPAAWQFWLTDDYLPQLIDWNRADFPSLESLRRVLGKLSVESIPIPADCTDGFLGAYWQRPQSYLDPVVRSAISSFSKIADVEQGIEHLRMDLQSGAWHRKYGYLLKRSSLDIGYRLVKVGAHSVPVAQQARTAPDPQAF